VRYLEPNDLLEINKAVLKELFKSEANYEQLLYTRKHGNEWIIREPELRFAYCNFLNRGKGSFRIEEPTDEKYKFTGKGRRKALTDLSLFEGNNRVLNIEFKEGQAPQKQFDKDIEKLMSENVDGLFFHLIHNKNKRTLKTLINKFNFALESYWKKEHKVVGWLQFVIAIKIQKEIWHFTDTKSNIKRLDIPSFKQDRIM
jgi:hypothetical protein